MENGIDMKPRGFFESVFGTADERKSRADAREAEQQDKVAARHVALYARNDAVHAADPQKREADAQEIARAFYRWVAASGLFTDGTTGKEPWMADKLSAMFDEAGVRIDKEEKSRMLSEPLKNYLYASCALKDMEIAALHATIMRLQGQIRYT